MATPLLRASCWAASSILLTFACSADSQHGNPSVSGTLGSDPGSSVSTSVGGTQAALDGGGGSPGTTGAVNLGGAMSVGGATGVGGTANTGGAVTTGGAITTGGAVTTSGAMGVGGTASMGGVTGVGGAMSMGGAGTVDGTANTGGEGGSGGDPPVDPSAPLTPVAFFPSKDRTQACADASVSIEFNRTPVINGGGAIRIYEASGQLFDSVTANPQDGLYYSNLVTRSSGGQNFSTDALDIVYNTVVFQPNARLSYGQTYYVTVDEGMISDSDGTSFSVEEADGWTFTVRDQAPASSNSYTLAADGSGDYCSVVGVLDALPDSSATTRVITVEKGVYPGVVRMGDSNVHFQGAGIDESIFSHKNAATMNSSREGFVLTGSDVTFENLTIFNTYLDDGSGQQAEALYVSSSATHVFLDNVHLRSQQDTLRVDGNSVYMKGGKISGSTDPLWGYGAFYCDGCELASRSSGHAFVVARTTQGFAMVNCSVTRDREGVGSTSLAQYHDGAEPGRIAFVNCEIDDHIEGWRRPENNEWYEFNNTDLQTGNPVMFNGTQLSAGSSVLNELSSPDNWLGWSP